MLTAFRDAQIPLLAAMLLGGCSAKLARAVRRRSVAAGLGPTALFPLRLRPLAAGTFCALELGMGIGLLLTATSIGAGAPAKLLRVGTCLLFVVATCALVELRSMRPDIGCGCFGEFSSAPITGRTLTRSLLLAGAAVLTITLPPVQVPKSIGAIAPSAVLLVLELGILAWLSPELRDVLVQVGYSAPCELRLVSPEQTLATLQRTAQWRRHAALIADDEPLDVWRELCWRYLAFRGRYNGKEAEMIFAVYLQSRRPLVLSALVDAATGAVIPWPVTSGRPVSWRWARLPRRGAHASPQPARRTWQDERPARSQARGGPALGRPAAPAALRGPTRIAAPARLAAQGGLAAPGGLPAPGHVAAQDPPRAAGSSAG